MNSIILFLFLIPVTIIKCNVPDFIHVCQRNQPDLADCIKKSVYALVPRLKTGIPELNVPSLEPFNVDNVEIRTGSGGVFIGADLTNLTVWNASTFELLELKPNIEKNSFRFKVRIPHLHLNGNYSVDTKILALRVRGNGPLHINVTDYVFDCLLKGKKIQKDDTTHLEFGRMYLNITIGSAKVDLENLFNGDPILGKATNAVINDNVDVFYDAIKPGLEDGLSKLFTDISNKITLSFDYKDLFP